MPTDTPEPLSDAQVSDTECRRYLEMEWFRVEPEDIKRLANALLAAREELEQAKAEFDARFDAGMTALNDEWDRENRTMRQRAEAAELEAANGRAALYVLNRKVEEERTKTRAAEANCAALLELANAGHARKWDDSDDSQQYCELGGYFCKCLTILARPNPGAGVLGRLRQYEAAMVRQAKNCACDCEACCNIVDVLEQAGEQEQAT